MATAVTKRTERTTDARTRSLELAEARGYHGAGPARSIGMTLDEAGQLISYACRLPSASQVDVWHIVAYDARRDLATCDCPAAQHGRACWHVGCGLAAGRYVARRARLGWPED